MPNFGCPVGRYYFLRQYWPAGLLIRHLSKDFLLFRTKNSSKVTMNANFVNNTLKSRFSGAKMAPLAVRVFTQGGGLTTLGLTLACEQQTHFLSSLLSLLFSDDRKCVCCSQARANLRSALFSFRFENNIPAGKAKRRDFSGSGSR